MSGFFKDIPPLFKGIIAVAGTFAIGFAGWKTYKYFQKKKQEQPIQQTVTDAKVQLKQEQAKGESLSFPASNYQSASNTIVTLLDGCETASSEVQAIIEVAKVVIKPIDWYYLISVFGVKEIADCGSFGLSKTTYDLPTLLKDQLDSATDYTININGFSKWGFAINSLSILTEYLQTKGITI